METYTFVNIFATKGLEYLLLIGYLKPPRKKPQSNDYKFSPTAAAISDSKGCKEEG